MESPCHPLYGHAFVPHCSGLSSKADHNPLSNLNHTRSASREREISSGVLHSLLNTIRSHPDIHQCPTPHFFVVTKKVFPSGICVPPMPSICILCQALIRFLGKMNAEKQNAIRLRHFPGKYILSD